MTKSRLKVGEKVTLIFAKKMFGDILAADGSVRFAIGADDKEYTGKIVSDQGNGYYTVDFKQGNTEQQLSMPGSKLKKA